MLGMSVLFDQFCATQGKTITSVGHRSIARTAGYGGNVDGWAYSTSKPGEDHHDGGGIVLANRLKRFCQASQPSDDEHGFENGSLKPATDGTTGSLPNAGAEYPDTPPENAPLNQMLNPSPTTSGYRWKYLWGAPKAFKKGDRARFTFSWEACVASASNSAARTVETDFDIFFYNKTIDKGLYASQSDSDVNEGFDVVIPDGWDGDYEVILVWPDGGNGCGGNERYGASWFLKRAG